MADKVLWRFYNEKDISNHTLILPSVAVGNVGQLACDLLISSLKMKKIGTVYCQALVPVLGHDPYDLESPHLTTSCELYQCKINKIVVLQIRAPVIYKYAKEFLENIVLTSKAEQVKDIIVLTSSYAHEKKHINTSPFRFICSEACPRKDDIIKHQWTEHEHVDENIKIYGGGYASMVYEICKNHSMPCLVIYKYSSEGDNSIDAYYTLNHLNEILHIFKEDLDISLQLIPPVSWKYLFGRPPPIDIY